MTKNKFTSFAAPTPEDIAAFDALTHDEQKAVIEAELDKGFTGETRTWNRELMQDIRDRALARHTARTVKIAK